nr:MAG TPA: Nuclease [Caudoviricetes sp.]
MYGNLKRGEDTEQMGVIDWANWNTGRFPELKMLFHVPNGGKRNAAEAARFKAMGVKAGVPDLCLPCPRGGYAGLYIEMKYGKNKTTENQNEWISNLQKEGYKVAICYGGEDATHLLEAYLQQSQTILTDPLNESCRPQKRIEIYCSSEDTDKIKAALQASAVQGNCTFGEDFVPPDCADPINAEDCAACVTKNVSFVEYD